MKIALLAITFFFSLLLIKYGLPTVFLITLITFNLSPSAETIANVGAIINILTLAVPVGLVVFMNRRWRTVKPITS